MCWHHVLAQPLFLLRATVARNGSSFLAGRRAGLAWPLTCSPERLATACLRQADGGPTLSGTDKARRTSLSPNAKQMRSALVSQMTSRRSCCFVRFLLSMFLFDCLRSLLIVGRWHCLVLTMHPILASILAVVMWKSFVSQICLQYCVKSSTSIGHVLLAFCVCLVTPALLVIIMNGCGIKLRKGQNKGSEVNKQTKKTAAR